jgi:hypothetical protein
MVSRLSEATASNQLRLVIDLLNSVDLRRYGDSQILLERDGLGDPGKLRQWLVARDLLLPTEPVTDEDVRWVRVARNDLRSVLTDPQRSRKFADGDVPLTLSFDPDGIPLLEPTVPGVKGTIALLLAHVHAVPATSWARVKICAAEECQQAFYDTSRNRRARWCSMQTCGNRVKTRAYRQRRAGRIDPPRVKDSPKSVRSRRRGDTFVQEGDFWSIRYAGKTFRVKDSKGLHLLAKLLRHPGREFHVLDLAGPMPAGGATSREDVTDRGEFREPILDQASRTAFKRRLEDLREQLREGEEWGDPERAARARGEIEALTLELRRATGLLGRERVMTSDAEKARVNVTRVIKAAMDRIRPYSPELRHHLASTIKTGTYCSYSPDPRLPLDWQL